MQVSIPKRVLGALKGSAIPARRHSHTVSIPKRVLGALKERELQRVTVLSFQGASARIFGYHIPFIVSDHEKCFIKKSDPSPTNLFRLCADQKMTTKAESPSNRYL
jgi:hypothetical protein